MSGRRLRPARRGTVARQVERQSGWCNRSPRGGEPLGVRRIGRLAIAAEVLENPFNDRWLLNFVTVMERNYEKPTTATDTA
jgi:hypothetical protein